MLLFRLSEPKPAAAIKLLVLLAACALLVSCSSHPYRNVSNSPDDYHIIPQPNQLAILKGRFLVNPETKIIYETGLAQEAKYLANLLGKGEGASIIVDERNASSGDISLTLDSTIQAEEGYELNVEFDGIHLSAKTAKGIFYGIQTLRQLLPASIEKSMAATDTLTIPAVRITDQPRYAYRGMHLDVARHFFSIDEVKKYIDLLAMHKMNTFHWHLTEDQGWRIQIKKYPKLTEVGAFRKGTAIGLAGTRDAPYTYDNVPYGGFYTQDEIRDVVAYAGARHITVIPEIELPGHSSAALAAYPQFGNHSGPYEVARRWGVFEETFAPTEETFAFLEDVLKEVMELFPSTLIHIGGDEVLKKEWKESAYAQALIEKEGLKDEDGLQSYFIRRIEAFLNTNGRSIIGWDEILEGGLAPNATVMSWRGVEGGIAAAKQQHNVIMTPGAYCYFDYNQIGGEAQKKDPLNGSNRVTTLEKVYSYEPTPAELTPEQTKYILGAQGNVWTEYMPNFEVVEYNVLPRMTALSEVVWSAKKDRDWEKFHGRLQHMSRRYDALRYTYAKQCIVQ